MGYTYRGKRVNFDNIAVGAATGQEQTISGAVAKEMVVVGTSAQNVSGGYPENYRSVSNSSYIARGKEFLWKTVCGGQVSDRTTDLDPKF